MLMNDDADDRGDVWRRRVRNSRGANVDDIRTMFGGVEDSNQLTRLTELARRDMAAAVLEYNELVLATASSNDSQARTCWMRLNHNDTTSPARLSDLFRDQVV